MATKPKKQTFYINARIVLDTELKVQANSLEEALAFSKDLKLEDFIDLHGENVNNDVRITGVHAEYESL